MIILRRITAVKWSCRKLSCTTELTCHKDEFGGLWPSTIHADAPETDLDRRWINHTAKQTSWLLLAC